MYIELTYGAHSKSAELTYSAEYIQQSLFRSELTYGAHSKSAELTYSAEYIQQSIFRSELT